MEFNLSFTPRTKKLTSVFVVEDSSMEQNMLMDFLSRYPNIQTKAFVNGTDCVKDIVVSNFSPDLILIDYFLDSADASSKDGLEILSKLREISPNSDIIMLTSVDNPRIKELARKKGAMAYVVKGSDSYTELDAIIEKNFVLNTPPEVTE